MPAEQLGFEGMPRRLFAATPSRLGTFTACPRRYRFTYLTRPTPPKGPPWAHNSMGAAAHNALRDWWLLPYGKRTPTAAGALLDTAWIADGFLDAAQSARWRARARDWVETYAATLDPGDEPVGVERGVAVRTERLALSGRVDRIDERDGELVIVDYKTGRWVPDTDDARGSLALAVYALAAARTLRRPCTTVELHHLPTGQVVSWRHTDASLARHVSRAENTADDIEDAAAAVTGGADPESVYPPVTGRQCGWCDFRRHCPQGRAASTEQAPWSGLAEPAEPADPAGAGPGPAAAGPAVAGAAPAGPAAAGAAAAGAGSAGAGPGAPAPAGAGSAGAAPGAAAPAGPDPAAGAGAVAVAVGARSAGRPGDPGYPGAAGED